MRILVAADQWFPDHHGGLARVATETSELLAGRGHDVTAIAPISSVDRSREREADVRVLRGIRRGWLPQTFSDPRETAKLARELGGPFDVLVGHNSTTATGLLRAFPDVPLVTVFHASIPLEVEFLHERAGLGRDRAGAYLVKRALERCERLSLKGAARILVLSEFTRSLLRRRDVEAAERAVLVPGAVDTSVFRPGDRRVARDRLGIPAGEVLVLTVRRLVHRMGLEELVEASTLLSDVNGLRVVIAGQGPLREDLESRVRAAQLTGRVELIGRISDEDLVNWYRAADLFVVPTVAYEGFGLVTAEALACGTPVVGTPVGATPELLAPLDPRLIARSSDPEAIADAVRMGLALVGPELSRRSREFALERFSWAMAIECWERQILEAANHAGLRGASKVSSNPGTPPVP
jgi:glycosyltransferase involved in cell wall biosynthesis